MAKMGKGVTLASHEIRPAAGGSKECVSVFKVDDINEFQYASPFLAYLDYGENSTAKVKLEPLLKGRPYVGRAGTMAVSFHLLKPAKVDRAEPKKDKDGKPIPPPPGPSPASLQIFRDLGPAGRDMLADFKVRLVFESYAPIVESGIGWRGSRQGGREVDLIHFSADDLDNYGNKFLENEPIMLDLVRGEVGAASVIEHTRGFADNPTLPVFVPWGSRFADWHGSEIICFKPSRELFNKYFVDEHGHNRKIDPSQWGPSPPDKLIEAKFEEIGYDPKGLSPFPRQFAEMGTVPFVVAPDQGASNARPKGRTRGTVPFSILPEKGTVPYRLLSSP
jgi:hypothetical protein